MQPPYSLNPSTIDIIMQMRPKVVKRLQTLLEYRNVYLMLSHRFAQEIMKKYPYLYIF